MLTFYSAPITTTDFADIIPKDLPARDSQDQASDAPRNYHAKFFGKLIADENKKYEMLITADDYYKLYINGQYVCQGPRPAYVTRYNYNAVDITDFLRPGENEICAHVFYQGLINRVWVSGDGRMMLLCDIFRDGAHVAGTEIFTKCTRITGYFSEHAIGYDTQFLEDFDFSVPEKPVGICSQKYPYHFYDTPTETMDTELLPLHFSGTDCANNTSDAGKNCNYFLDVKQETAGSLLLTLRGTKGQTVWILRGEELTESGDVRFDMRCGCLYKEQLILSGNDDIFEEFDSKAFRYISVTSDAPFMIKNAALRRTHHRFRKHLTLKSGSKTINDVWKLCENTLHYGVQETLIDCPTREKGEYLGDAVISALAYFYLTGDAEMYRHTLIDFADTAHFDAGLLAVGSCSYWQEIADFSLLFPLFLWNYFRVTNDKNTANALLPVCDHMLSYFGQFAREDGLLADVNQKWNLVDWPESCRDGYDAVLDGTQKNVCHNVINAYYIGAHIMRDKLAAALGIRKSNKATAFIHAFQKEFFNEKIGRYTDTAQTAHTALHSNVLPLFYGFAPESAVPNLIAFIKEKRLSCSPFFSYFLLKALARNGERDFALSLVCDEKYWVNMLAEGATTTMETWGKNQKQNTSLCHPWACAPIILIAEDFPELTENVVFENHPILTL